MQLISTFSKGFRLCFIDVFSKCAWNIPLKDKKSITITDTFQKLLKESNRKARKTCYMKSMKSWLEKTTTGTYSRYSEGKSVVTKRFIRTLKKRIYKYMTSIPRNVYIEKLDDIVNKHNNTIHSTIKMKPVNVNPKTYINSSKEINDKDSKFEIGVLLEYQNIKTFLEKAMFQIGLKNFLCLKKLKTLCCRYILLVILKANKLLESFTKKNCKKQIKKILELKK